MNLLPHDALATTISPTFVEEQMSTPRTGSFMHLHIGINATGLPSDLESHYSVSLSFLSMFLFVQCDVK